MIETYLLRHLAAFRKYGTLTEAAKNLHLTQATLSRSMKKLEESFGIPLFVHGKNRIVLNECGKLAADYAEKILLLEKQMVSAVIRHEQNSRILSFASSRPGPLIDLQPIVSGLYPGVEIRCEHRPEPDIIAGLRDSAYDLAVLDHPLRSDAFFSIKYDELVLVMEVLPSHRCSHKKAVTFKEANGENFLTQLEKNFLWHTELQGNMPDSQIYSQDEIDFFKEVAEASPIPLLRTTLALRIQGKIANRIVIPFSDPEAHADLWCVCRTEDKDRFEPLFAHLQKRFASGSQNA